MIFYISVTNSGYIGLGTMKDRFYIQNSFFKLIKDNIDVLFIGDSRNLMSYYSSIYARFTYPNAHASFYDNILFLGVLGIVFNLIFMKKYLCLIKKITIQYLPKRKYLFFFMKGNTLFTSIFTINCTWFPI